MQPLGSKQLVPPPPLSPKPAELPMMSPTANGRTFWPKARWGLFITGFPSLEAAGDSRLAALTPQPCPEQGW